MKISRPREGVNGPIANGRELATADWQASVRPRSSQWIAGTSGRLIQETDR